jgi:hypothetical protein
MRARTSGATYVADLRLCWSVVIDDAARAWLRDRAGRRAALYSVANQPRTSALLLVRLRTWLERSRGRYGADDAVVLGVRMAVLQLEHWVGALELG